MNEAPLARPPGRLSRREWALVCLGLVAWIAIAAGGAWLVRQWMRPAASCGAPAETPTGPAKGAPTSPRNAFQLLTGTGRCP